MKTAKQHICCSVILFAALVGCDEALESTANATEPVAAAAAIESPETGKKPFSGEATVQFGDDRYDLDLVVCINGMIISAVASDLKKRVEYPVVKLGTSDPKYTGGTPMHTVSLMFSGDGLEELWQLDEGGVSKEGKIFAAEGTVKGRRMEKQADGTLRSRPLAGDDIKPFRIDVKCR